MPRIKLCETCALADVCVKENHPGKLTVYCIEGYFLNKVGHTINTVQPVSITF